MSFKPTGGFSLKLKEKFKVTDKLTLCAVLFVSKQPCQFLK